MATAQMTKSNGKTPVEISDIEAQLTKLTEDLSGLSKTIAGLGSQKASDAGARAVAMKDEIATQVAALKNTVAERSVATAGVAKDRFMTAEGEVEDRIRAHPLAAVGIAAGVGFLMALMAKK